MKQSIIRKLAWKIWVAAGGCLLCELAKLEGAEKHQHICGLLENNRIQVKEKKT